MMKALAGIPTRKRKTSGRIADTLAEVVDKVVVISQGATCIHASDKVEVLEYPENFGLVNARNEILKYAVKNGYDLVIQSDDDITFVPEIADSMLQVVVDYRTIGACASEPRAYYNWNKDVECNKPFLLAPCAPQLWAARTEVLCKVGWWRLPFLEDREYGCRTWLEGLAIVQLHHHIDFTHNPFMARTATTSKSGGQEEEGPAPEDKHAGLKKAIEFMDENYGAMITIKYLGLHGRSFSTRYNWKFLLKCHRDMYGNDLGYEDSKGRIL